MHAQLKFMSKKKSFPEP